MRQQAEAVAGIKSRQASPSRIRGFISGQDKLEKNRKQAEKVTRITSALDVLDLISGSLPPRETFAMEIKRVSIDADMAEVHGYTDSAQNKDQVRQALARVSGNGKTDSIDIRGVKVPQGKVGFAFRFPVQRISGG
ncbi:MAG: hypothetical protein HC902_14845 [Calothrix sp. SM1_5_4]|nr:hypothetical protein [Calothrix sp. SM1_5_4]